MIEMFSEMVGTTEEEKEKIQTFMGIKDIPMI